jgi:hypothetical protein
MPSRTRLSVGPVCMFAVAALLATPQQGLAQPAGAAGTTIIVNTTTDLDVIQRPGDPPICRLRDAIQAANMNQDVRGCLAGQRAKLISAQPLQVNFVDRIVFDIGSGTPTIKLRSGLPIITEAVTIDGATFDARRVEISGGEIPRIRGLPPVHGLVVMESFSTLKSLVLNGFGGAGILLTYVDEDMSPLLDPPIPERPGETWSDPCASPPPPMDPSECRPDPPSGDPDLPTLSAAGGGSHTILDSLIGTDATGSAAIPNGDGTLASGGIVVLTAGNTIGGIGRNLHNVISGNHGNGVLLDSVNNRLLGNLIGVGASNHLNGVLVDGGQFQDATCEIRGNTIVSNGHNGVDAGFNSCWILSNSITENSGLGIERAAAGPTANDAAGRRSRPPNFPMLEAAASSPMGIIVSGTITQWSTEPITLSLFDSPTCDPSNHGEGATLVATTSPQGTLFRFRFPSLQPIGNHFYTATATTVEGGTSEFSLCLPH